MQLQNLTKHNLNNDLLLVARRLVKQRNLAGIEALFGSAPDILSQLVRTAFIPSDGNRLIIADYSAIEARVIAWLAGEAWRQEVFRTHGKIYEASAAAMFGVPIETIVKGHDNYALRQRGKVAELGLGYGMGAPKFKNEAEKKYKVDFTDEEAQDIVRRWRDASPKIEDFWVESEEAALVAMRSGYPVTLKNGIAFQHKTDTAGQHFLTIQLPSGRELFYAQPEIGTNRWGRPQVGYYEKAGNRAGTWVKQETYGGKLVENITQAVARDCLALAIERAVKAGFHPVMHVHDEIICDDAPGGVDALCALMAEPIPWAPSLILRAEGFEAEFYKKE